MPTDRIERITGLRRREQARMKAYMETEGCLMQFLADELSDPHAAPCGKCANCTGERLGARVSRRTGGTGGAVSGAPLTAGGAEAVLAPGYYLRGGRARIAAELRAEEGRALCKWGDAGFGDLIRDGKRAGHFADRLVEAAAELVQRRWRPTPAPEWVTCVPSRRRPTLVPDFARWLAARLGLPFIHWTNTKDPRHGAPEARQNSFQQVQNLENAFEVDVPFVRSQPVLLVDDMVDSRWTFTVLACKLRKAGAGPVFPFALADSSADDGSSD